MIARGVEAACWMAGRDHDYPEQFAAGLEPHAVQEKYYYARRPEITRVVDISGVVDQKVDANRANRAKGPAGHHGSRLRAELAKKNQRLPLLGRRRRDRRPQLHQGVPPGPRTASWAGNTAWSTPRRSTTSGRAPRGGSRTTSASTRSP